MYWLIAPMVAVRLLQDKLTLIDLELDVRMKKQYILAKTLYFIFADDSFMADCNPSIEYNCFVA